MFVIVHDNFVILGPIKWHKNSFERVILEECEYECSLPARNDELMPITVADNIKILPVQSLPTPNYDSIFEFLNGPFWEFTEDCALMSFKVEPIKNDAVKSTIKALVSDRRWRLEESGEVDVVLASGEAIKFPSDRQTRAVLNAIVPEPIIRFKLNTDNWLTLADTDLIVIKDAISAHVQQCFNWEYTKLQQVDASTTVEELKVILEEVR